MCYFLILFLVSAVFRTAARAVARQTHLITVGDERLIAFERQRAPQLLIAYVADLTAFATDETYGKLRFERHLPGVGLCVHLAQHSGLTKQFDGVVDRSPAHTKITPLNCIAQLVDSETRWHVQYRVEHGKPFGGATPVMVGYVTSQGLVGNTLALVLVHHSQNYNHGAKYPKFQRCFCCDVAHILIIPLDVSMRNIRSFSRSYAS